MRPYAAAAFVTFVIASVSQVSADVTLKQVTGGKLRGQSMAGDLVQYIKGTKMRTEQTIGSVAVSSIMDVGAQQLIMFNHAKKVANVIDLAKVAGELPNIPAGDLKASMTPTPQKRQLAGSTCTVHDMKITVPMQMGGDTHTVLMSGTVCLVSGGPSAAEYATFKVLWL